MAGTGSIDVNNGRSGRYVRQPSGYRAFVPAPLPPDPPVRLSGNLLALLSRADRALGRLDGSIHTLPHPDLFVAMYVRKEAVLSSQIEGTQSSLQDVLAAEARVLDANRPRDVSEVFNRRAAGPYDNRALRSIDSQLRKQKWYEGQKHDKGYRYFPWRRPEAIRSTSTATSQTWPRGSMKSSTHSEWSTHRGVKSWPHCMSLGRICWRRGT